MHFGATGASQTRRLGNLVAKLTACSAARSVRAVTAPKPSNTCRSERSAPTQRRHAATAQADAPVTISRPLGRFLCLSLRLIVWRLPNRIPPSGARSAAAAVHRRIGGQPGFVCLVHGPRRGVQSTLRRHMTRRFPHSSTSPRSNSRQRPKATTPPQSATRRPRTRRSRAPPERSAGVPDPVFWKIMEFWQLGEDWRRPALFRKSSTSKINMLSF